MRKRCVTRSVCEFPIRQEDILVKRDLNSINRFYHHVDRLSGTSSYCLVFYSGNLEINDSHLSAK